MKAEVIKADGYHIPVEPADGKIFTLRELQKIVGGTIQIIRLPKTKECMVMHEEGKLRGFPRNAQASELFQKNFPVKDLPLNNDGLIVGDVLVSPCRMVL
jgi:hypothetical protein